MQFWIGAAKSNFEVEYRFFSFEKKGSREAVNQKKTLKCYLDHQSLHAGVLLCKMMDDISQ